MKIKKYTILILSSLILTVFINANAIDKLHLEGKNLKGFYAYKDEDTVYVTPELLEDGGRWKIQEEKNKTFAIVKVGNKEEKVEIPIIIKDNKKLVDFDFFSKQAGLKGEINLKRKTFKIQKDKQINLKKEKSNLKPLIIWDPDSEFNQNSAFFTENAGIRIISPTLGSINVFNNVFSNEFLSYLKNIQDSGMEVMPLIHNNFDPDKTRDFVKNSKKIDEITNRMAAYSEVYRFDGYNIDFENMYKEDKNLFTNFIKELSSKIHARNKKLSIDITVIEPLSDFWSMCYDRKALSEFTDYQVIMGYDETPAGSKYAGSVSSYNWLNRKIPELLNEVPAEKLILGIPFYTRAWIGYDGSATSSVLTIKNNREFIMKHNVRLIWQEKEKQYKGIYKTNGLPAQIWMEEKRSLGEKIKLAKKYKLGGLAFWRYGFESSDIYSYLENKWINNYSEYDIWNNSNGSILEKIRKKNRIKNR